MIKKAQVSEPIHWIAGWLRSRTTSLKGFTLSELAVTVGIMGVLAAVAIPVFSGITEQAHGERNIANIQIIRESFFKYYFRQHILGNPHFPHPPEDGLMDDEWANTPIPPDSVHTPASLFSDRKVPMNSLGNPFFYDVTFTFDEDSVATPTIFLKDTDEDSHTFGAEFSFSL